MRSAARPVMAVFDQGQTPRVAVVNLAKVDLGVGLKELVDGAQKFVTEYFSPHWRETCVLEPVSGTAVPPGYWALVISDDTTEAEANGFHDLTPDGYPLAHVFAKTTLADGQLVSVTFMHELLEMLADPAASDGTWHLLEKRLYAKEPVDPVQTSRVEVGGIAFCSFVFPSWFEQFRKPGSDRFDYLGECTRPFQVLKGGYIPILEHGAWSYRFGSRRAEKAFNPALHPRLRWRKTWRGKKSKPRKAAGRSG
jgi:hypothetical protein